MWAPGFGNLSTAAAVAANANQRGGQPMVIGAQGMTGTGVAVTNIQPTLFGAPGAAMMVPHVHPHAARQGVGGNMLQGGA